MPSALGETMRASAVLKASDEPKIVVAEIDANKRSDLGATRRQIAQRVVDGAPKIVEAAIKVAESGNLPAMNICSR